MRDRRVARIAAPVERRRAGRDRRRRCSRCRREIARERQAFDLQRLERRFRSPATSCATGCRPTRCSSRVWESGTVRYHADRESLLWDSLDPAGARSARSSGSAARGLDPFIVVEQWEEPLFRERFAGHSPLGDSRLAAALRDRAPGAHLPALPIARRTCEASRADRAHHPALRHAQDRRAASIASVTSAAICDDARSIAS